MEKVLQTWLDHQCRMLPGSIHAVLLTGPPEKGPYDRVLLWPDDRHDPAMLSRVAQVALRNKKTVMRTLSNQGEKTVEPLDVMACPLFMEDHLLGAVAIKMTHRSLSNQRAAVQQVQAGTRWLEAMIELPQGSKKKARHFFAKKVFQPVQSRRTKWLGTRHLPLKVGLGLTAVLLVGIFLVSTIVRTPAKLAPEEVVRHAVAAPQQRYMIKEPVSSDDPVNDGVTQDDQQAPREERMSQPQDAQLHQEQSKTPANSENTEIGANPTLSEEKPSSVTLREIPNQAPGFAQDKGAPNTETETSLSSPIKAVFSIEIGPIIREQNLKEATNILSNHGFDSEQTTGRGTVQVTRLLEGVYTRDIAQARFRAVQKVVNSAFIIPEKGKLAIYVATYHDPTKANQKIRQLAQKNIQVTAVATEMEMRGPILVVEQVDQTNLETITDQMSELGLSVNVIKSG